MVRMIWAGAHRERESTARSISTAEMGLQVGLSVDDGFGDEYPGAEFTEYTAPGYPELEWGSRAFLVRHPGLPAQGARRLIIYNHGHGGWYFNNPDTRALLKQVYRTGYDLLLTAMPMVGWNAPVQPVRAKTWDGWGSFMPAADSHSFFAMLNTGDTHYIKYFLDPVLVPLSNAISDHRYGSIDMVGISGGGWTALLVGAIEPRIGKIISVAGFLPMRFRNNSRDIGDSEQVSASFYRAFNYDFLVKAASESVMGRRELWLIYNEEDPCCFGGPEARRYAAELTAQGRVDVKVIVRESRAHDLDSEEVLRILADLAQSIPSKR